MLLRVIALDYDGTIAANGVLNPDVREAILEARHSGIFVVIVTGRILQDLRRVAGDLDFVDGVVAENGAVILLSNGHRRLLGPPPFPMLMNELSDRGIEFIVGRCLVEMDAEHGGTVLSIIREQKLPLMISFNRSRMMVLPQAISKASGLRELMNILGTSVHNAIGIGDAENDYALIKSCEYGVAVEWAPDFLKNEADFVLSGTGQSDVAEYIRHVSSEARLPHGHTKHWHLVLESQKGQSSFEIAIRGRNILIAGDSKTGKSWIAGLFCEQMILQRYTVLIIDPEGDYSSLASLPNTLVLGGGNPLPELEELLILLRQGLSVILNFSHLDHEEKISYIHKLIPLVARYRRNRGYPHFILIDECHYFLDGTHCEDILDPKQGSYVLVTYRPTDLPQNLFPSLKVVVATRMVQKEQVDVLRRIAGQDMPDDWYELLSNLKTSEAVLLPPTEELEGEGQPRQFSVVPRLTLHVRHRSKYFNVRVRQDQAFVYTDNGQSIGEYVLTLSDLAKSAERVSTEVISGHLRRHDFSRWVLIMFDDSSLASEIHKIESMHVRNNTVSKFAPQLSKIIEQRYTDSCH